jgi:hypothetical protein
MRVRAVLLAALIVLSGCNALIDGGNTPTPTETPQTATPTATPVKTTTAQPTPSNATNTSDSVVLGRENGYWYNATLSINSKDGLNKTERKKVISRAMARVEYVRQMEFKQSVSISLQSRKEYKQRVGKANYSSSYRRFDNAKFEAMFIVGEKNNSLTVQRKSRGQSVLGYYSSINDSIVIVTNSKTPSLNGESTLAHELTHALQDQYFNLTNYTRVTRDGYNAMTGLIEGGASLVQQRYMSNCGKEWKCLPKSKTGGPVGMPSNWGLQLLNIFPYTEGPAFVNYYQQRGGWERVNELFANPPVSSEQVIYAPKYGTDAPSNVTLKDRTRNGWTRVRPNSPGPGDQPDYASLGQSALTSMFARTIFDSYNPATAIPRQAFLNLNGSGINRSDPYNYGLSVTDGWDGDRMHVYTKNDKTAYVWKIVWDSPKNASQFATAYHRLLRHWGGTKVATNTWVIQSSPYADAFLVKVSGDTVIIVNAPTVDDLYDVRQIS